MFLLFSVEGNVGENLCFAFQGSYASGKCQGNLNFFKVRELSGNFMLCQGKMNVCINVREMSGNLQFPILSNDKKQKKD